MADATSAAVLSNVRRPCRRNSDSMMWSIGRAQCSPSGLIVEIAVGSFLLPASFAVRWACEENIAKRISGISLDGGDMLVSLFSYTILYTLFNTESSEDIQEGVDSRGR